MGTILIMYLNGGSQGEGGDVGGDVGTDESGGTPGPVDEPGSTPADTSGVGGPGDDEMAGTPDAVEVVEFTDDEAEIIVADAPSVTVDPSTSESTVEISPGVSIQIAPGYTFEVSSTPISEGATMSSISVVEMESDRQAEAEAERNRQLIEKWLEFMDELRHHEE